MPQERILYADTAAWRVERVVRPAGVVHAGSTVYQVATPRWVFPVSGVSEFHIEGRQVLLDGLTVVALPTGLPYRVHEWQATERSHMVVSMQPGSTPASGPGQALAWSLSPRALWQLRLHWRALAQGREQTVGPMPAPAALGGSSMAHAAVARARRFMATRTAAADGLRWSLHDVADAACCSYFHLARLFRAHTGLGLHAYREQLRLAVALQRLEEGEGDLAALAHDLGYSSQSHLGTALRREVGVTPAQARQALRG
ncbi:AraC-like DNA-binding protein [Acidovorax soli]|uniref:AraC-like DNA-binding protein n=1 Tax=Acidovorax soli TaxID=592050 RepID=A0A7X0U7T1_9BURK|nr:helix-turn-helix transcriptional regulator [Acidovorax soli]MBB6558391.1 AraC-like DNA-binding protein [Acidovorax soli]